MENERQLLQYQLIGPHFNIKTSKEHSPDWYRQIPRDVQMPEATHGDHSHAGEIVPTVKHCMPFLDGMAGGYMISLEADLDVKIIRGEVKIFTEKAPIFGERVPGATDPMPVPLGCIKRHFHWIQQTIVQLPIGYSALYTHPLNRFDLPFVTLSAIIDDRIKNGNIPFFIKEGFEGVIEKGTPIIQIIPFKRENWESEQVEHIHTEDCAKHHDAQFHGKHPKMFDDEYRKERWQKKSFK